MTSLIWNALWSLALAGLFCSLPLLIQAPVRTHAALVFVRSARGRRVRRGPAD
ncbi:hypothetical protein RZS28_01050 [Methylocapsa polymorpha]|uniref:Uncharacterized protein n=1 Tax=Methylocapsa polymorpha TaxID=3080828 RepID=A0ABZ0HRK6_9HYPH|nr:hypothetical protein RZS28_01050 [Methylocapsa sp. RX1]